MQENYYDTLQSMQKLLEQVHIEKSQFIDLDSFIITATAIKNSDRILKSMNNQLIQMKAKLYQQTIGKVQEIKQNFKTINQQFMKVDQLITKVQKNTQLELNNQKIIRKEQKNNVKRIVKQMLQNSQKQIHYILKHHNKKILKPWKEIIIKQVESKINNDNDLQDIIKNVGLLKYKIQFIQNKLQKEQKIQKYLQINDRQIQKQNSIIVNKLSDITTISEQQFYQYYQRANMLIYRIKAIRIRSFLIISIKSEDKNNHTHLLTIRNCLNTYLTKWSAWQTNLNILIGNSCNNKII